MHQNYETLIFRCRLPINTLEIRYVNILDSLLHLNRVSFSTFSCLYTASPPSKTQLSNVLVNARTHTHEHTREHIHEQAGHRIV